MTGKDVALDGDGALSAAQVSEQIQRLRQARDYVRSCSEGDAMDAKRNAELVREWVRIQKAAASIALEACKLQFVALRRLGQLESTQIKGAERSAAIWLAGMPDAAFDELLADMRFACSPIGLYRDKDRAAQREKWRERGRDIGRGEGTPVDPESVSKLANELLHQALSGGSITVNELTDELADWLDLGQKCKEDYLMREGVEAIIREALRSESFDDEAHPDFITWKDKEAGWLRIPWGAATLPQLQWMASYRHQQASELQEAADELASLADHLGAVARNRPELTRLSELWAALKSGGAA